jgi:hypothetical protein
MRAHNTKLEQTRQSLLQLDALPAESLLSESQEWKSKLAQLRKRKALLTKRISDKERASLLTSQAQILREIELLRTRETSTKANVIKLRGKEQALSHQLVLKTSNPSRYCDCSLMFPLHVGNSRGEGRQTFARTGNTSG